MHHAKSMPEDDILVVDALFSIADPFWEADVRIAGRLGDVPAGRPELVVAIYEKR